jgi:hypothetical protein
MVVHILADLAYRQHGGSGYGYGYLDVLEMEYPYAAALVDGLNERRQADARAIERANRQPAR